MRKIYILLTITVVISSLVFFTGCDKEGSNKIVSAGQVNLYNHVPDSATGLFTINFNKLASLSLFDKMKEDMKLGDLSKKQEFFKNYEDFVSKTGIDPKEDIKSVVIAFFGELGDKDPDVSVIANLKYDGEKLLGLLKESGKEMITEDYKGVTFYTHKDEKGKEGGFAFLSDNIILAGTTLGIKKVVDLSKGEGANILNNPKMKSYLAKAGSSSILSFVFQFPEKMKGMKGNGMIRTDFSKAEALYGNIDFKSSNWLGEIVLISFNEEGNNNLVNTLNGLKGLGAMGGPEVAELINNININATPDSINISFKISEELLEKLKTKAEEKAKTLK